MTLTEVITSQAITRTTLKLKKINSNTFMHRIEEHLLIAAFRKAHSCMTPPLLRLTLDKIKNLSILTIFIMMISLKLSKLCKIQITLKLNK
jgi:hypothetical protein